ncbi:MAG: hypothetical protein ACREQZ_03845, partial [Woeseiaceae bacterium]
EFAATLPDHRRLIQAIVSMTFTVQTPDPQLERFLREHRCFAVLSGAGCSTASGIPEYRDDHKCAGDCADALALALRAFAPAAGA